MEEGGRGEMAKKCSFYLQWLLKVQQKLQPKAEDQVVILIVHISALALFY